jgi:Zn-dependent metalloprotease
MRSPHRRSTPKTILTGVVTVALAAATVATVSSTSTAGPSEPVSSRPDTALQRLRADAGGRVEVHRDANGRVDFVAAADGAGITNPAVRTPLRPAAAARAHLDSYGAVFGLGGDSAATLMSEQAAESGASTVRFQQTVGGLPVIGGELVVSLDADGGLTSILAETTAAAAPAVSPGVSEAQARATALRATAKYRDVKTGALRADSSGRWLYDPALIGPADPIGPRTVWRFEVSNGVEVREFVLVDAATGRIALHFSQLTDALNRVVCDNANVPRPDPVTCDPDVAVRSEGDAPVAKADVNAAYDYSGATSNLYDSIDNVDLTELIGVGPAGSRRLTSTVWWCFTGDPCPYPNAFWNGVQMFYGQDYASADDVVGHELTHGYTEKTSNLLYWYQSGAINESMSDVIGEIVDHRRGTDNDNTWLIGEDLPIDAIRNMSNPPAMNDPDRMRSPLWFSDPEFLDNGGVHFNSGVGNKTAYLISQGGSFNGQNIVGIDGADDNLTKTAHLYIDTTAALTSGSDYADLGRVLSATCNAYVAGGQFGFTAANCNNVRKAILATQLAQQPVSPDAQAPEAKASCPRGTFKRLLYRDNVDNSGKTWTRGELWIKAPGTVQGIPIEGSATSGRRSYFGLNSDPRFGEPPISHLTGGNPVRLPAGWQSFMHFKHWYLFEHNLPSSAPYYDGGAVSIKAGTGPFLPTSERPWINGPTRTLEAGVAPQRTFAGSSHGYQSSRLNLTWLAGKRIQPRFSLYNDPSFSHYGWYLDDITIYTCPSVLPSAPRNLTGTPGKGKVKLSWQRPAHVGIGLSGYRVGRVGGPAMTVGRTVKSVVFKGLGKRVHTFKVRALNRDGDAGPAATVRVRVRR